MSQKYLMLVRSLCRDFQKAKGNLKEFLIEGCVFKVSFICESVGKPFTFSAILIETKTTQLGFA